MNNSIEIIEIDHGWSQMKTSNYCFNTSIKELPNVPAFTDNVLQYDNRHFAVGDERLEVLDSKVENENFYLLTLVAMAKEMKSRGIKEADIALAVGLPLTRFSAERKPFIEYLSKNEFVAFTFENDLYRAHIMNVSVFPQCYAAIAGMLPWNLDQNDTKGWVREKGEFMLGLCEQCIGDSLNSRKKSIIDRCVRKMYIDIARSREKYIPVMSDFYDILMAQPEEEAKDIALSLELFVNGSLNIFNHQTNVDVDNRFTVYGIRDLGTELSPITMLANSEFVALLKQANTDSSKMAEVIGVSDAQLRFVTNNQSGMGLLKCGNVVIPFDNQIRKDTSLYKLYNTNLHEIIENSRLSHLSKPK